MQTNAERIRSSDSPLSRLLDGDHGFELEIQRHVLQLQLAPRNYPLPATLRHAGWHLHVASSIDQARTLLGRHVFPVGLLDLGAVQPGRDWLDFLANCQHIRWIALLEPGLLDAAATDGTLAMAIHALCHDFHLQPEDGEHLRHSLAQAWNMAALRKDLVLPDKVHQMVGQSLAIRRTFELIPRLARADAPVLIQGESGTGKELAARAIHQCSGRAEQPFIAVNCGALPATLVHSELFGHERGAFSGATHLRIGRIEAANGGTLFLDEVGDLPLDLQVNLLRFLQEGTIERLGASQAHRLDVRVIAATHVELERATTEGRFREDLYYRLNVLRLAMPALRDRPEDIPVLAWHAFRQFRAEGHGRVRGFSPRAMEAMQAYDWPGNVREIINRVRRAMVLCDHPLITPSDLELDKVQQARMHQGLMTLAKAREHAERITLQAALNLYRHNFSLAARRLGVSRATFYRLLQRHTLIPRRS